MWSLSMFISTITRYQMTHLAMFTIESYQEPYKMSSNHIKGRNLGTIWLSYMHYFPWILIQPTTKFRFWNRCPFCTTSHPPSMFVSRSFLLQSRDLFRDSYTYAVPEVSLEMLCLGHFILQNVFLLILCGEQGSKWQGGITWVCNSLTVKPTSF